MSRGSRKKEQQQRGPHVNKYAQFSKADEVAASLDKRLERARREREANRVSGSYGRIGSSIHSSGGLFRNSGFAIRLYYPIIEEVERTYML